MANEVAEVRTRLPMPQREGLDAGLWRVLCESAFPAAKSAEAILLALDYCKARKLDPLKKMVHIVPMWSSQLGREVETVWPGIAEVQTTATRTGKYAGMDEPKFGPDITRTFRGVRGKNVGETEVTVTFPEWCSITVYRIVDGQRCPFTEPVYWLEAYGRGGKSELPNDQWIKRPRGMIMKVAKAFSLRAAFPEEADYTKEEMEGRAIEDYETTIEGVAYSNEPVEAKSLFKTATLRKNWAESVIAAITACKTINELKTVAEEHKYRLEELLANGNDYDIQTVEELRKRLKQHQARLKEEAEIDQTNYLDDDFRRSVDAEEKQAVEVNTPSVVVTAPSPATVALKHFRDGKPKWEYWVSEAIDALNKCDDVGAWLKVHDKQLEALKVVNEEWYKQVNEVAIERMG